MIFLGRMYFTDNDSYQNFLVFATMLSFLILDNYKKITNWTRLEYHLKQLNHLILTLTQQCLI